MAMTRRIKPREVLTGRLSHEGDLLEQITDICRKENIQLGWFEALGAVKRARLAFYNQETHDYEFFVVDQPLEITKLVGNVSLKDGNPFIHAHITLADKAGNAYGGHLASGTVVFACEFILEIFDGPVLKREFDEVTGLSLWTMPE
ncbi:MAG TPA: PPC domain-containing DNA-binding protein [Thermodesulfobacteriota bacterium]|nr:PPC domain-containing DNA-binding protein [Thermodesulfobacteriota bacterium]